MIGARTGADLRVCELFAFLHDSRRQDEWEDPDHGARAAEYAAWLRGKGYFELDDSAFALLQQACIGHSLGETRADATIQACWDSDRLDLGRVGIRPDPRYLCTAMAQHPGYLERAYRWSLGRSLTDSRPQEVHHVRVDDAGVVHLDDFAPAMAFNPQGRPPEARTSLSHPLRIDQLPVGNKGGAIGLTFAPGKWQPRAMTGAWARDLDADLQAIRDWGATDLISLIEPFEFTELRIASLPERTAGLGIAWHGLPITDQQAPDHRLLEPWSGLGPVLADKLHAGDRVVVHCKGGLGRAGTVATMLLIQTDPDLDLAEAMRRVRKVRPDAIETEAQERFLRQWFSRKTAP